MNRRLFSPVAVAFVVLVLLEIVAWAVAPAGFRPVILGVLAGTGITALLLIWLRRLDAHSRPSQPPSAEGWLSSRALERFPMDAVRPLLNRPNAPDLRRLYAAWTLALLGYESRFIARHLRLPTAVVRLLTDAAPRRGRTPAPFAPHGGVPADDPHLPPVRRAVRQAARRLADDAPALTSAGAETLHAGLAARADALRQAVLVAHRAGMRHGDIAHDAHLDLATIDEWTAPAAAAGPRSAAAHHAKWHGVGGSRLR
ncbi:hypothetical protein LVX13_35600 [Streptomyces albulus]|uniref:hypothetical protein n=1 Tax=Streptomyces noursei TaxID=1971 RepID=UPI001F4721C2|nr:hypothetical protein [Streptomyces noursei]MCE4948390.1 hypothetical protein [Streptomyces noursei]